MYATVQIQDAGAAAGPAASAAAASTALAAATAALTALRDGAKRAHEAHVDVVELARGCRHRVEVLSVAILVRRGNQIQQCSPPRVGPCRRNLIVRKGLTGGGIHHWAERRQIPAALGKRRPRGIRAEGIVGEIVAVGEE